MSTYIELEATRNDVFKAYAKAGRACSVKSCTAGSPTCLIRTPRPRRRESVVVTTAAGARTRALDTADPLTEKRDY